MPKLISVTITALKDDARVVTARKKVTYLPNPGLNSTGFPEGQTPIDEQVHGIVLRKDQTVDLDLREDQLDAIRDAVAAGTIEAIGLPPAAVLTSAAPPLDLPPANDKKGSSK